MPRLVALFVVAATTAPHRCAAQCGPGGANPYPPGSSTCPGVGAGAPVPPPPCSGSPCPASLLGDVGTTTVAGTDARTGDNFPMGENIYGPFEAGFASQQDNILSALGCSTPSDGYLIGGIDTNTAEQMVAHQCSITLPRVENAGANGYISLLDECGGHTNAYHFHEKMECLYDADASTLCANNPGHSPRIGTAEDGKPIYGKWENCSTGELPVLDACGGQWGVTPDSNGAAIYHYQLQDSPPFSVGCFGPAADDGPVGVAECRSLYNGCGDGDTFTATTPTGSAQYDPWCPCWENGTNVLLLGNGAEHVGGTHISAASSPAGASTDSGVVDKTSAAATTAVVVTSRLAAGAVTAAALFV